LLCRPCFDRIFLSPRGPVDPTGSAEKDRIALDKLRANFAVAFNAKDPAGVANLYSPDAVLMPSGESAVEGRAAIQRYLKAGFDQFTIKASLTTSQEFTLMGADWGYDRGKYAWIITPKAGGNPSAVEYNYLTLVHREPDGWKVKRDIYTSTKP
jgi:uncharacterized protein (TIGR02246 family)